MKPILLFILLFPLLAFSQPKYSYRPAPRKGEIAAITGIVLVAVAASPLAYNNRTSPSVSRVMAGVGGAAICAGVVVDLGKGKKRVRWMARR
jgi:peptidoglycan/LPS O-acetylase OafA/YrhL